MRHPDFLDVVAAASTLKGHAIRTPVFTSRCADALLGAKVFFKCENFQRVGAFKFRGAFNAMATLNTVQKQHGVVAFSTGNHAQAIALSARILNIPAVILMPKDAPAAKIEATKAYGKEVVFYDRFKDDREKISRDFVERKGMTLIPPFDHPYIVAGQGTAAMELIEEVGELDYLLTPFGGGGLLAGTILAAKAMAPSCRVYGVEPEAGNDGQISFRSGSLTRIPVPTTIADGAQAQCIGAIPFEIIRNGADDILTASDAELAREMHFLAERMKIIVEPTGCLGLAGAKKLGTIRNKRVGIILSGGNLDLSRWGELLSLAALV